jgi:hypothetical protein
MNGLVFFTDTYRDRSTRDGYQFEFFCRRCGVGYTSTFQPSGLGVGGAPRLGRDLAGEKAGGKAGPAASRAAWEAQWLREGGRADESGRALRRAVQEVQRQFSQCRRCGTWVCRPACWLDERDVCAGCG